MLIELNHHQHGKTFEKLAKELHVTNDKVKSLTKKLAAKDLCKKFEKHRAETDQTITGMLSKDETLGLVNVLKKMLKSSEDNKYVK